MKLKFWPVVEHSPYHLKVKGSSPATTAGTGRVKLAKKGKQMYGTNLLSVIVVSPGVHLSRFGDGETVECADSDVNDLLAAKTFNDRRFSNVLVGSMAKSEVIAFAPSPNQSGL